MSVWRRLPVFEGKVAVASFLLSVACLLAMGAAPLPPWAIAATELLYMASLSLFHSVPVVRIVLVSHGIGAVFSLGLLLALSGEVYGYFGLYLMSLAFFHISEYILTSVFNPHTLSLDSFLINHSMEYGIAVAASWTEYAIELYFFPGLKSLHVVALVGLVVVVGGEALRKAAMVTAASNFTHIVQFHKRSSHSLVTHGVYALFRHPSYVGWFCWSVGTQLLLCNPICAVGFAVASWSFFSDRIPYEEELLIQFFKEDYVRYMERVGPGLPFIKSYSIESARRLLEQLESK